MRNEMLKMELPAPEFWQEQGDHLSVFVTLRNKYKQRKVWLGADAAAVVGDKIYAPLLEQDRQIVNISDGIRKNQCRPSQRLTVLDWSAARRLLDGLVK